MEMNRNLKRARGAMDDRVWTFRVEDAWFLRQAFELTLAGYGPEKLEEIRALLYLCLEMTCEQDYERILAVYSLFVTMQYLPRKMPDPEAMRQELHKPKPTMMHKIWPFADKDLWERFEYLPDWQSPYLEMRITAAAQAEVFLSAMSDHIGNNERAVDAISFAVVISRRIRGSWRAWTV